MSALRLSVPGQPTVLIDQGPSVARITHAKTSIRGALVTAAPPRKMTSAPLPRSRDEGRKR